MSFNDPVAELLTKVRNASRAKHRYVDLALTKMNMSIVDILKEQGFIENFLVNEQKRKVRVFLKYRQRNSLFSNLKRISSPGMRKYVGYNKIPRVKNGLGIAIVSTSKGVLDGESARHQKVGGELLCVVE
ncbi:MAG: 30S ribosomal protein S8 [Chlamydiae bacterium CG10_big_fil_rev_8_21_14_0_10_35_9]|nr:MAG: 30S ribosomal protein S8 [Chlamydiae bacterium CG10_big_fil_rev_8_21_14_0_10_35_9]